MELIIRVAISLLWLIFSSVATAQETAPASAPQAPVCHNAIQVQTVLLTLEESDLNSMYVKWFNSGVPLDNGTGIRQERAIVPGGSHAGEGLITLSFTATAKGETQIRRKSWFGMADSVVAVIRDGLVVFTDESLVQGIPQISEVQTKCF